MINTAHVINKRFLAFYLAFVLWLPTIILLLWAARLALRMPASAEASFVTERADRLQLVSEDSQFRIYVANDALTRAQVDTLLAEANKAREQLPRFLELPDSAERITIRVYDPYGSNYAIHESDSIRLRADMLDYENVFYHEMTHILAGWSTYSFRAEGLATFAAFQLVGSQGLYPWPPKGVVLTLVDLLGYTPLEEFDRPYINQPPANPASNLMFYRVAGDFTEHLVNRYGWEKYWQLYQRGHYEEVYGRTLPELEQEWLAQLATYKRIRYAPLALLGLLCVVLLARAVQQPAPSRRALAVGTPGILASAAAVVPAPFPVLAAILLGLLALLLGWQWLVERWPRGVWWTAVIVSMTLVIGLIIVPGWNIVLRYA